MKLWQRLYALVWLAFAQILVAVLLFGTEDWTIGFDVLIAVHVLLGVAIVGWTQIDLRALRGLPIPDRIKRIAASTAQLAAGQFVLGIILLAGFFVNLGVLVPLIGLLHLVIALAIITQASSAATAYDMWEEKEFGPAQPAGQAPGA